MYVYCRLGCSSARRFVSCRIWYCSTAAVYEPSTIWGRGDINADCTSVHMLFTACWHHRCSIHSSLGPQTPPNPARIASSIRCDPCWGWIGSGTETIFTWLGKYSWYVYQLLCSYQHISLVPRPSRGTRKRAW